MWKDRWASIIEKTLVVHTSAEEQSLLDSLASGTAPRVLGFVNAHAMNTSAADARFYEAFVKLDILLRDGFGMAILFRMLHRDPGLNMNGTDFIPKVISAYKGRTVAFWGTQEPYVGLASAFCQAKYGVRIVSVENGFQDTSRYLCLARSERPELIVLGMGMPKQESVARALAADVGHAPLIVCGGAILDFLGGKVPRAPAWVRQSGTEWLYRLYREPKRLFRRYIFGNPAFLLKLFVWRREERQRKGLIDGERPG
jgi:N-acetylglucosaminyldiphosphoundecaprenol N-acetyl-beta-D-mannosaminyltransferase